MNEVWLFGLLAFIVFGAAYYQSFRNGRRWKRIVSGRSMDANRDDYPVLSLDGQDFEPNQRRVMIVWGDMTHSGFHTAAEARKEIDRAVKKAHLRSQNVRLFVYNGDMWMQR